MKKIKLLVVDDSLLFREVLARYIRLDEQIEIVGMAGDAYAARDMIEKYEPDVMTLDIEMPRMDGVAFLKKLLPERYIPTVIVSSSQEKLKLGVEAGAVDCLSKPIARTNADMQKFANTVCTVIKRAYSKHNLSRIAEGKAAVYIKPIRDKDDNSATIKPLGGSTSRVSETRPMEKNVAVNVSANLRKSDVIVALGASTGGTEALEQVIRSFPEEMPPVLVVQHMPAGFTKMYAERLNRSCKVEVKEAEDGDRLRRGLVIIGAGEHHLRLCKDRNGYYVSSRIGDKVSGHCPSVDVLFESVAQNAGGNAAGAILTGMGKDGAEGLLKMRNSGCFTVGQDKATCVVYGMPMEAYNIGAVQVQAPLYNIADIIMRQVL